MPAVPAMSVTVALVEWSGVEWVGDHPFSIAVLCLLPILPILPIHVSIIFLLCLFVAEKILNYEIREIHEKKHKIISLPENKGPAAARNAGIAVAEGEWQ